MTKDDLFDLSFCDCPQPTYFPNGVGYECGLCGRPIATEEPSKP